MLLDPPFCDTDNHRVFPVEGVDRQWLKHFECSDCGKVFYEIQTL